MWHISSNLLSGLSTAKQLRTMVETTHHYRRGNKITHDAEISLSFIEQSHQVQGGRRDGTGCEAC